MSKQTARLEAKLQDMKTPEPESRDTEIALALSRIADALEKDPGWELHPLQGTPTGEPS